MIRKTKTKNKNKGKTMYQQTYGYQTTTAIASPITKYVTSKNQGIILITQTAMDDIFKKSGEVAVANEFQTHYWSLNLRHRAADGSLLDICIPTCYFNYEQECTAAHIDFELKDVIAMSEAVMPIHNMKVNELLEKGIHEKMEALYGIKFELISENFNSIHRHPGGSAHQSFSGTDYGTSLTNLGIVFPLASAKDDKANFAGIMAIDSGKCNVAHYEYRVANGDITSKMDYIKGRCVALIKGNTTVNTSAVESLFGIQYPVNRAKYDGCTQNALFDATLDIFIETGFEPDTDLISAENVKKKSYYTQYSYTKPQPFINRIQTNTDDEKFIVEKYKDFQAKTMEELEVLDMDSLNQLEASLNLLYYKKKGYTEDIEDYYTISSMTEKQCVDSILEIQNDIIKEYNEAVLTLATVNKANEKQLVQFTAYELLVSKSVYELEQHAGDWSQFIRKQPYVTTIRTKAFIKDDIEKMYTEYNKSIADGNKPVVQTTTTPITKPATISYVTTDNNNISENLGQVYETDDLPTVPEMRATLLQYGVTLEKLNTLSDDAIISYYNKAIV